MNFPSNRVRIMVATKPADFRKGHDGLAALVKNELHKVPFTEQSSCSGRAFNPNSVLAEQFAMLAA